MHPSDFIESDIFTYFTSDDFCPICIVSISFLRTVGVLLTLVQISIFYEEIIYFLQSSRISNSKFTIDLLFVF